MYFVDEAYLAALRNDPDAPDSPIYPICTAEPFFDIALLGDACVCRVEDVERELADAYEGHLGALSSGRPPQLVISAGDLIKIPEEAADHRRELLESAADALLSMGRHQPSAVLAVPGNFDVQGGFDEYHESFVGRFVQRIDAAPHPADPRDHPVAAVFRIHPPARPGAHGLPELPWAYVAVVGFDSNHADSGALDYGLIHPQQLTTFRKLIDILRTTVSDRAPLYVVAVTHHNVLPVEDRPLTGLDRDDAAHAKVAENVRNSSADASGLLEQCRRLRVSLLVQAHMHERQVLDLTSTPLDPSRVGGDLTVLSAPTLQRGRPVSGMARVRLDLAQGSMELAVDYARGPDGAPGVPVQTTRKLTSASRISVGERRLYDAASRVIEQAIDPVDGPAQDDRSGHAQSYRDHVVATWRTDGCVPLGLADGQLPQVTDAERQARYNLLLLLRRRQGRYEVLLSRHTPLKPTEVGAWDTLLMPAFTDARALLEHLYDDVVRLLASRTTDMAKAASGREFVGAVRQILATQERGGGLWTEEMRELDQLVSRKLSPTTGQVTVTEYHLMVLLPLVQETRAKESERSSYRTVVNWLNELPSVKLPGEPIAGAGSIPIEALYRGGGGLRWEPSADPDDDADEASVRRSRSLAPGAIWFPLPDADERAGLWTRCPLVAHRNLDVLDWVKREIDKRRDVRGDYPPHLLLGEFRGHGEFVHEADGLLPFQSADPETESAERPALSTMAAMRRVTYSEKSDLSGRPYAGLDIRRVVLQRRSLASHAGPRDVIMVFDATELADSRNVAAARDLHSEDRLGILRPVQRYVIRAGLDRAERVNGFRQRLVDENGHDPWGFVRARYGDFGEVLSLTPPIIEELWPTDTEFDIPSHREFVLCDGNHRVVRTVWRGSELLAAVAVLGRLPEPYYAFPFSSYEWENTASQIQDISPPAWARYAARRPPREPDSAEAEDPNWYRRFYRDLSTGFGNVGAQGGRA
jgi:hypothetical protein